jgi:hypothetical protein
MMTDEEKLREAYAFAREERATADTLLWEVSAIIWGGQTLLFGFVLEAISGSRGALILVIVVACIGIFMAFFNSGVTKKRSEVCNKMVGVITEIEEKLSMPIRPQARISDGYRKGSQTLWSKAFNVACCMVWFVVILVAASKLRNVWLPFNKQFHNEQRFTHIGNSESTTYVMFDQKTAQACWAGPQRRYTIESPDRKEERQTNEANLPFCKQLK